MLTYQLSYRHAHGWWFRPLTPDLASRLVVGDRVLFQGGQLTVSLTIIARVAVPDANLIYLRLEPEKGTTEAQLQSVGFKPSYTYDPQAKKDKDEEMIVVELD